MFGEANDWPMSGQGEDYRNNPNNLNLIPTQFLGTLLGQKRILFDSGNESS
jgi:hypothetical protein